MMMPEDIDDDTPPTPNHLYVTTLIPHQETVSWKIHNVSALLQTQAWTAMSIPLQVGVGATELSTWNISLMARNNNTVLCARTMLISPQEQHRRVTHHLKVAVTMEGGEEAGPVYYFPAPQTTTGSTTNNSNNPTNSNTHNTHANLTNNPTNNGRSRNDNAARCGSMRRALRRIFIKNAKLDGDDELIGDGRMTKEARPAHKAPLCLWKIIPIDKIRPGEDDCIELRVTLTVFGCDVEEKRI